MDLVTLCLLGLFLLLTWYVLTNSWTRGGRYRLPPGPRGLPLLGCPWALRYDFEVLFTDLAKSWGDIVSINIMGKTIVSLNSAEVVRAAFSSPSTADVFAGRTNPPVVNDYIRDSTSFVQPGPLLLKQRKLMHKILNHYGEGLRETEKTVQEELTHVIQWLQRAKPGKSVDMDEIIYPSLINITTILLTGRRYDYDSETVNNIRMINELGAQGASAAFTMICKTFPFLKYIPIGPGKIVLTQKRLLNQVMVEFFDDVKNTYDSDVTRGMMDFLFRHQEESRLQDGSTWLEDKIIKSTIQEIFTAGILTTRGALYSFFLIIACTPKVAERIQNEIDVVIGGSRFPNMEDRLRMPYTMAAMLELLRYISHVPVGLPHRTTDDVVFRDYFIPKNTMVIYNSWCLHHDERTFPDPWEFKPERFLDADGQLLPAEHQNRKNSLPFGIGRRSCVGEAFAKSRMFLFITTLLQRFNFTEDPARPLRSCDPRTYRSGIVNSPFPYSVNITARS